MGSGTSSFQNSTDVHDNASARVLTFNGEGVHRVEDARRPSDENSVDELEHHSASADEGITEERIFDSGVTERLRLRHHRLTALADVRIIADRSDFQVKGNDPSDSSVSTTPRSPRIPAAHLAPLSPGARLRLRQGVASGASGVGFQTVVSRDYSMQILPPEHPQSGKPQLPRFCEPTTPACRRPNSESGSRRVTFQQFSFRMDDSVGSNMHESSSSFASPKMSTDSDPQQQRSGPTSPAVSLPSIEGAATSPLTPGDTKHRLQLARRSHYC